jgi:RND family efflux transporter MFP subunit
MFNFTRQLWTRHVRPLLQKSKGFKLPLIAALGLVFALYTVLLRPDAPAREPVMPPPATPFAATVSGIGVIEPRSQLISVGTEIPGLVRQVHVKVGDRVKAGDPLFTLDERDITAQIEVLEAALSAAKIQAQDASAQYALVAGIGDKRAVAQDDVNRRKFASALAKTRVEQTAAQLEQARTTRVRMTVQAPIDGEILSVDVRPGEFAGAGAQPIPLIRMGDTSTLHVRVEIDEENAVRVRSTAPAKGMKRGAPGEEIALRFVRFEPYVKPKTNLAVTGQRVDTRVLEVIYALEPAARRPFVGERMDVFIDDQTANAQAQ